MYLPNSMSFRFSHVIASSPLDFGTNITANNNNTRFAMRNDDSDDETDDDDDEDIEEAFDILLFLLKSSLCANCSLIV